MTQAHLTITIHARPITVNPQDEFDPTLDRDALRWTEADIRKALDAHLGLAVLDVESTWYTDAHPYEQQVDGGRACDQRTYHSRPGAYYICEEQHVIYIHASRRARS